MRRLACSLLLACLTAPAQRYLVVPFSHPAADSQLDWIGESVSESIHDAYASYKLSVISRDARVDAIKRLSLRDGAAISLASWLKVAEQTGATRLILGDLQFTATEPPAATTAALTPVKDEPGSAPAPPSIGSLRVVARILDATRPAQLAEFSLSAPAEQLGALEAGIAWRLLNFSQPPRLPDLIEFRRRWPVIKLNARESYIRGLMASTPELKHRYFTQAARLDPAFANPRYYLGLMHFKAENYREAAGWLDKISPDFPEYLHARFMLGFSRFELSEFGESRAAFEDVAARLPLPELWNNLGAAQLRLNLPDARQNIEKAFAARPSDPDFRFNLGYVLWRQGEFHAAAEQFRAVLDRLPNDEDSLYLLGRCLKSSGPRNGDLRTEGLLRLKDSYDETK